MDNKFYDKRDFELQRKEMYNKSMMEELKGLKFLPETPYEILQQSILSTEQRYGANHAMEALKLYIETGKTIKFTRQNHARENMEKYSSIFTAEFVIDFLNYVSNLAMQKMKINTQESLKYETSKANFNQKALDKEEKINERTKHDGIYVVSDLHGEMTALHSVLEQIKLGKKVIILGDATDRGDYGIEILQKIMQVQSQIGHRIEYIPGNHDEFLYEALYKAMKSYEQTGDIRFLQNYGISSCDEYLSDAISKKNGLTSTYKKLKDMLLTNPQEVYKIGKWLEKQPLLRIEYDNNKKIALGHASFDMDLYKRNYNLKNYMEDKTKNSIMAEKARLCLWYRDTSNNDVQSAKKNLVLPSWQEAIDIVVGHTPYKTETILYGKNGERQALCVDIAEHGDKKQYWMAKYDSRRGDVSITFFSKDFPELSDQRLKDEALKWIKDKISSKKQTRNNSRRKYK